jgi:hypothetical protein
VALFQSHRSGSDWLSYNEVDLAHPENTVAILKPESNPIFQRFFPRFQELAHQHPLITRQQQSADFPVHKISDFLSQKSYRRLELYQEVYRHLRVEYQIAATIKLEPERITAFALSRERNDYTERDRVILEMLQPHLVIALNNLTLAAERQAILNSTELVSKELSFATIIVGRQNQILYHTGPGLNWIENGSRRNLYPLRANRQPAATVVGAHSGFPKYGSRPSQ